MFLRTIAKEIFRGKSLSRTLLNLELQKISLKGRILDLGSKNKRSSYYRFIKIPSDSIITFSDINPAEEGVIKIDLNGPLPFDGERFDSLLLIQVLYLLRDPQKSLQECYRILSKDGILIGATPFIYPLCHEPIDYLRFSDATLKKLLEGANFKEISITHCGFGPVTAGISLFSHLLRFRALILLVTLAAISIDKFLNRLFPGRTGADYRNYPLVYLFTAKK